MTKDEALYALDACEVRPKQRWRHLKNGHIYTVIALGIEEATRAPVVIYAGPDGIVWTRPLFSFLGDTEQGRPRFLMLEDEHGEEVCDAQASAATDKFRRVSRVTEGLRELAEVCP